MEFGLSVVLVSMRLDQTFFSASFASLDPQPSALSVIPRSFVFVRLPHLAHKPSQQHVPISLVPTKPEWRVMI